jgi:type IX secretion system PorP/SprF family membrane protein
MKKFIIISIIASALFFTEKASAQQDPMFSQYMFNTMSLNPAYAGSSDLISSSLITRHQWLGIKGAPQTQTLAIHSPLKKQIGAGISVIRDQAGPVNNFSIQGNFSYHLMLSKKSELYFGLMAGMNNVNIKLTEVVGVNVDDISFQQNLNSFRPVFGFGLYYRHPKAYAGISIPDLAETGYTGINSSWEHKRHYFLIAGYITDLNDNLKLRPTMMMRYVKNAPISAEVTASVIYNDLIWFGLMYRVKDAAGALFCFQINPQLRIGYSYDYSLNTLRGHQGGSHEVMISYDFSYKAAKYVSPRYF